MELITSCYEDLKAILKNIRNPALLDNHPWTRSLVVQEQLARDPRARLARPGQQLIHAIASLFTDMQPATPPRRGKRLDPRWGEFGLLAALYFIPFRRGTPFPTSLLEAWRRIDPAILEYVYGKPVGMLTREEVQRYQLVGEEVDYGSASTLSDWHRKGVQRLADILANRERFLSSSSSSPALITDQTIPPAVLPKPVGNHGRFLWAAAGLLLVVLILVAGLKSRAVYLGAKAVLGDVGRLQAHASGPLAVANLDAAHPLLLTLKEDLSSLQKDAGALLWLSPGLAWVPEYGGDLAAAPDILQMASHLVNAADIAYQASRPLLGELGDQESSLDPAGLTGLLVAAQPQLAQARQELQLSMDARQKIDPGELSPRLRTLLVEKTDPLLERADRGLSFVTALPVVLGATAEGPKTYLLLVQNEDELRATGGFITSVGRLVVHNGQVISLEFEQVDHQEDWSRPYPAAPWQMRAYMNSRVLVLRDANWSPDFPTAARQAEYLYAYTHSLSVDGVIAIDQQFLVMLLRRLGPLQVEGAPDPITAENVIPYMRSAKRLPAGQPVPPGWHRKEFMNRITTALLTKLIDGGSHDWKEVAGTLVQAIEERHLLMQFDHPQVANLLVRQGWQNSLVPGSGDFLMVTDTNMGFNKTNAVVEERIGYEVNLADPARPLATLTVSHANHANPDVPCIHWNNGEIADEASYPIDRCYWSYVRVYKQAGVELTGADPQAVPGEWMLLGKEVPAQVDELEEQLPGIAGFGTLIVVPGGQSQDLNYQFALPAATLAQDPSGQITYRLKVQKQPGTGAIPIDIRIVLPAGATLLSVLPGSVTSGSEVLLTTGLRTDVELEVGFRLPQTGINP